jgi:hypothetical protein
MKLDTITLGVSESKATIFNKKLGEASRFVLLVEPPIDEAPRNGVPARKKQTTIRPGQSGCTPLISVFIL